MSKLVTRRALTERDRATVLALNARIFTAGEAPPNATCSWLVWAKGEPVAFACALYVGDATVYMSRVGVLSAWRGRGLQRRLLRVRERWARRCGWHWAVTDTTRDNYPSMISLVREHYLPYNPREPWAGAGALYWRKEL